MIAILAKDTSFPATFGEMLAGGTLVRIGARRRPGEDYMVYIPGTSGCFLVSGGWLKLADRSLNGYLEKSSWEPALRFLRALLLLDCKGSAAEYSW